MVAYLTVRTGPEKGKHFPLDPHRPMHVGRGTSCEIMLSDPISSRFHAVIYFEDDNWHVRDTSSRNGTLVNGQKTDHARLLDESVVTVGNTDLQLVEPSDTVDDSPLTQTIVQDAAMDERVWQPESDDPLARVHPGRRLVPRAGMHRASPRGPAMSPAQVAEIRSNMDRKVAALKRRG